MSHWKCAGIGLIFAAAFWGWIALPFFVLPFAVCWLLLAPFSGQRAMQYGGPAIALLSLLSIMPLMGFTTYVLIEIAKGAA